MIIIVIMIYKRNNRRFLVEKVYLALWYFLIQVVGRYFFLLGGVLKIKGLIILALMFKIGLFPFPQWAPYFYKRLNWMEIFILGIVAKVGPIIILVKLIAPIDGYYILIYLLLMTYGTVGIFRKINNLKIMFGWSSLVKMSLVVMFSHEKVYYSVLYFFTYSFVFFILCLRLRKNKIKDISVLLAQKRNSRSLFSVFTIVMALLWMVGLPGFPIFWVKVCFLNWLVKDLAVGLVVIVSLLMVVQMLIYIKIRLYIVRVGPHFLLYRTLVKYLGSFYILLVIIFIRFF